MIYIWQELTTENQLREVSGALVDWGKVPWVSGVNLTVSVSLIPKAIEVANETKSGKPLSLGVKVGEDIEWCYAQINSHSLFFNYPMIVEAETWMRKNVLEAPGGSLAKLPRLSETGQFRHYFYPADLVSNESVGEAYRQMFESCPWCGPMTLCRQFKSIAKKDTLRMLGNYDGGNRHGDGGYAYAGVANVAPDHRTDWWLGSMGASAKGTGRLNGLAKAASAAHPAFVQVGYKNFASAAKWCLSKDGK